MITKEQIMLLDVRMLTLNEPFASLMAFHDKQETRTRDTKVRGLIAIHSALEPFNWMKVYNLSGLEQYERIRNLRLNFKKTLGKILAVGYLQGTKCMGDHPDYQAEIERICFVKYKPELWIWEFVDITPVHPISIKGAQGWQKTLTVEEKNNY